MKHMKLGIGACTLFCLVMVAMAADTTTWTTNGRYVELDGDVFFFEGVNYSPVPIGASQVDDAANRGDVFTANWNFLYQRDLPLMREMGANSLRVYNMYPWGFPSSAAPNWTKSLDLDHTDFLDACWNDGTDPIYVWITYHMGTSFHIATSATGAPDNRPTWRLPNGLFAFMDPQWDSADALAQELARNAFISLANKYGSHPAVAGFVISNEQNNDQVRGSWQFWKWFDATAFYVKAVAPSKLTSMTLVDDGMLSIQNAESFDMKNIDVWGVNSYRGTVSTGFDTLFSDYAATSNRPLFIGEFGPPASTRDSNGKPVQMANNAQDQGDYLTVHWEDILDNRDVCCGGLVFEWVDEWWKHGNPNAHDATPTANAAYPGGWADEEWFGLYSVAMKSATASPSAYATRGADVLTARAAVQSLSDQWNANIGPAPPQAPPTPITLVPYEPMAPLVPINVPQAAPITPAAPGTPGTPTSPASPASPSSPNHAPSNPSTTPSNRQSSGAAELSPTTLLWVTPVVLAFSRFLL